MKKFVFFVIMLYYCVVQASGQGISDTSFLLRELISPDTYHAVFVTRNKKSVFYTQLQQHIAIDTNLYNQTIKELRDSLRTPLKRTPQLVINRDWYSLHQYKSKYFMYSPSEPYFNTWLRITDSTVVMNYFNDGVLPAIIKKAAWKDPNTLAICTISKYDHDNQIIIHFVNKQKGIMVLEFPKRAADNRYILMVSSSHMKEYPLIVNYCRTQRVAEWKFDKSDFSGLLESSKPLK
jgi:hypothetical protein